MPAEKVIRFQPQNPSATNGRTFEITVQSDLLGYAADVVEVLYGGERLPVIVMFGPRFEIAPSSFYRMRQHYRGMFIADVQQWIDRGPVTAGASQPMYMRANLTGWKDGHPSQVDDDLSDWKADD